MKKLVKVPCKCGCSGCYYDSFEKCPIADATQGNIIGNSQNWECVVNNCIYVEVDDE